MQIYTGHSVLGGHSSYLTCYTRRSWRRPGITPTSSNHKVDSIMTYVDLHAYGFSNYGNVPTHVTAHSWRVILKSPQTKRQRFPSELLLAFTVPWWTTGGVRYGSPGCPVVVGRYSSSLTKRLVRLSIQSVRLTTHDCSAGI